MTEMVCVKAWLLIALFVVGFVLGYFGDIFLRNGRD